MSYKTIILLGGNQPDTLGLFETSLALIQAQIGKVVTSSSVYKTAPWGFVAGHDFLNQVVEVETSLAPMDQLRILLKIEVSLGRKRKRMAEYESRGIDLDLLFMDDLILDTPQLTIPHPRLHLRRFTLEPLCEHWKELVHPILKKTMAQLLQACPDQGRVEII